MKSYVIQIEENNKSDKGNLIQIIKSLAGAGLKIQKTGIQKVQPINLKRKSGYE